MNRLRRACSVAILAGLAALAGCASVYEGKYDFSDGWREATVVRIARGSEIDNPQVYQCLRKLPVAERATRSYAVMSYKSMSRTRRHVVPVPAHVTVQPSDQVYLNVRRCEDAIARRAPVPAS